MSRHQAWTIAPVLAETVRIVGSVFRGVVPECPWRPALAAVACIPLLWGPAPHRLTAAALPTPPSEPLHSLLACPSLLRLIHLYPIPPRRSLHEAPRGEASSPAPSPLTIQPCIHPAGSRRGSCCVLRAAEDALQVMATGAANRKFAETAANRISSRSHCVFTLSVECTTTLESGLTRVTSGRLHIVDLAGSERSKVARTAGRTLAEANDINQSLSALGRVISKVPPRSSTPAIACLAQPLHNFPVTPLVKCATGLYVFALAVTARTGQTIHQGSRPRQGFG